MKGKDMNGKIILDNPVLKGCDMEKERRELKQQLEDGEKTQDEYAAAVATVLERVKKPAKRGGPIELLVLPLQHGIFCFMLGTKFQRYQWNLVTTIQFSQGKANNFMRHRYVDLSFNVRFSHIPHLIYVIRSWGWSSGPKSTL